MNPTNSAKRTPSTGNKPGDTALKARAHSVSASVVNQIHSANDERSGHKDNQGHPKHREIEEPVSHLNFLLSGARQS